jgi:homogentisate 1,2-dioxygenase
MAFMFETRYPLSPTGYASNLELLAGQYPDAWDGLTKMYKGEAVPSPVSLRTARVERTFSERTA